MTIRQNIKVLTCSVLFLFSCSTLDSLNRVCPPECYELEDNTEGIWQKSRLNFGPFSQCKIGTPVCDEDFNVTECEGAGYPDHKEICDGVDNNCNGEVDEGLSDRKSKYFYPKQDNPCINSTGECAGAIVKCRGKYICDYGPNADPNGGDNNCDGKDNDCDGRTDEDYIGQACFGGIPQDEWWRFTNGECRIGLELCVAGQIACVGLVEPTEEICDGVDQDCNGIIDDTGEILSTKHDIVFIIDTSGSMCTYITAVGAAADAYVEQFEFNPNFRFAIVNMSTYQPSGCWDFNNDAFCDPIEDRNGDGFCTSWGDCPLVTVDTNFSDIATIRNRLISMGCSGYGYEASLDSMTFVADKQGLFPNNPIGFLSPWGELSWHPEANALFFMFTDELPQTYESPPITGQIVTDTCLQNGVLPAIWSRYPAIFGPIATSANGIHFDLVNDWVQIFDDENAVIVIQCGM